MGYTKQNFTDDEYLCAEQLSKMEDAILELEKNGGSVDVTGLGKQIDELSEVSGKVINQNDGGYVRLWFGTEEEYNSLSGIYADVMYCIFDKTGETPDKPIIPNEPENKKLSVPVIRIEGEGGVVLEGTTPAILGVAVLGKTILGVTSVLPKLGTPTITLHKN